MNDSPGTGGVPPVGFELLDHTADVGIRAWGRTAAELFAAAACGLFTVIADPDRVEARTEHRVEITAETVPHLLHAWLDRLNLLHQLTGEIFSRFDVAVDGTRLTAVVAGEPIDPARHDLRTEVKAVTWHGLEMTAGERGLEARVLLDI